MTSLSMTLSVWPFVDSSHFATSARRRVVEGVSAADSSVAAGSGSSLQGEAAKRIPAAAPAAASPPSAATPRDRRLTGRVSQEPRRALGPAPHGPRVRSQPERQLGQHAAAELLELLHLGVAERLRVGAGRPDPEVQRLPPLLERLVLCRRRDLGLLDLAQPGRAKELDEVPLARARATRLGVRVGIELPHRLPEVRDRRPSAVVIPDARRDDAARTCDAGHLAE